MAGQKEMSVRLSADKRTAYVKIPGHIVEPGVVKRTIHVQNIVPDYKGPWIAVDFDANGRAIGIEVLIVDSDLKS